MALSRREIDSLIARLDQRIPALRAAHPDNDDFAAVLAGELDPIDEEVAEGDSAYVQSAVDDLLRKHGIAVSDDEAPGDG